MPINSAFMLGKEFYDNSARAKEVTVIHFISVAKALFPNSRIISVLDGAFATVQYLKWTIANDIATEVRMHANRKVLYIGKKVTLKEIKDLVPKGRQMSRTIQVVWQGLTLWLLLLKGLIDMEMNQLFSKQQLIKQLQKNMLKIISTDGQLRNYSEPPNNI